MKSRNDFLDQFKSEKDRNRSVNRWTFWRYVFWTLVVAAIFTFCLVMIGVTKVHGEQMDKKCDRFLNEKLR